MTARDSTTRGGPVASPAHTPTVGGSHRRILNPAFYRPATPPLERGELAQAMIDVTAILFGFLFVLATSLGLCAAFYILFFVEL